MPHLPCPLHASRFTLPIPLASSAYLLPSAAPPQSKIANPKSKIANPFHSTNPLFIGLNRTQSDTLMSTKIKSSAPLSLHKAKLSEIFLKNRPKSDKISHFLLQQHPDLKG
jgi:hypothetical protein